MILQGKTVCEFSSGLAGPFAGLRLRDLGANVIKVEAGEGDWTRQTEPKTPGGESALYAWLNRGKKSLALGGDPESWRDVLQPVVKRSDIFITDLDDVTLVAAGLDGLVEDAAAGSGEVIVVRISAFGREGPFANRAGSELVLQAMAGYTRYLGSHDEPPLRVGADVAGVGCGIFTVQAVLAAMFHRARSGSVQLVDVSELGSLLAMKTVQLAAQSEPDAWGGPRLGGANDPPERGWQTADRPITFSFGGSVGATGRPGWVEFVREIGLERLLQDDRFDKRGRDSTGLGPKARALKHEYEARFKELPSDLIVNAVRRHTGIAAAFNNHAEVLAHEQTRTLGIFVERADGTRIARFPVSFSRMSTRSDGISPSLGEHSIEIAAFAGLSDSQIHKLASAGIIITGESR